MYIRKKVAKYKMAITNLEQCGQELIDQKTFIALTGCKPTGDIAHVVEEYVLPDELCDHRGYEHGKMGTRYKYYVADCIEYFKYKI